MPEAQRFLVVPPNEEFLGSGAWTLPRALGSVGYTTALVGKWHLGEDPTTAGFDTRVAGSAKGQPFTYFPPYKLEQFGLAEPDDKDEYLTPRLTREALGCVQRAVDARGRDAEESPFFVMLSHFAVHEPWSAPATATRRFASARHASDGFTRDATYAAMVSSVDDSLGAVRDELARLGLGASTLLVFASDNGGVGSYASAGSRSIEITSNRPLRGGKGTLYEGGLRVPLLLHWPARATRGGGVRAPVRMHVDLFATLTQLAGAGSNSSFAVGRDLFAVAARDSETDAHEHRFDERFAFVFPGYLATKRSKRARAPTGGSLSAELRTAPTSVVRSGHLKLLHFHEVREAVPKRATARGLQFRARALSPVAHTRLSRAPRAHVCAFRSLPSVADRTDGSHRALQSDG